MYVPQKSPALGKSRSLNFQTSGGEKEFITNKRKSTFTSPSSRSISCDNARRNSRIALSARGNRDGNQRSFYSFSEDSHILTVDDLYDAYDDFVRREGELTYALSQTQEELEEQQIMFEKAVGLGEQLRGQILDLNEKLQEQIDLNSILEKQVHVHKEANNILTSTLSEAWKNSMDTQKALNAANESTSLMKNELEQEKIYSNRIQDNYIAAKKHFHSSLTSALEALEKRLEDEKAKVAKSLEEQAALKRKLLDQEDRLNLANSKLAELDSQLVEKESSYSGMVLALAAAKGNLETENKSLAREIKNLEDQLKEINERFQYHQRTSECLDPLQEDGKTLADEIARTRDWSGATNLVNESAGRISQSPMEQTMELQIPEIIQSYLQITAMAVQLHFPNMKHVNADMLIDMVRSSPFYLYHDLMMVYMRKMEDGLAYEDARKQDRLEADRNLKSASEQSNFLTRFFRLKHGKDNMIGSKHRNIVKSLTVTHSSVSRREKRQNSKSLFKRAEHPKSWQFNL